MSRPYAGRHRAYRRAGKRSVDLVVGSAVGLLTLPLLLVVAGLVRLRLGSPVLFRQERPGRDGKPFVLVKFRTMTDERDASGALLPDEARLTPLGQKMRALSLDEIPEVWNVVRGDMSLVGPRPLLMKYLPLYTSAQARRHDVRPGITGWAQVNGRNHAGWHDRLAMDTWYVDNLSPALDLRILAMTVSTVLRRHGINEEGRAAGATEFRGGVVQPEGGESSGPQPGGVARA
jgi:lipopolysaccharide/colanic/teichoic acid biosynthesis glycosyltransferase